MKTGSGSVGLRSFATNRSCCRSAATSRRIMVEVGEHCHTFIIPRIKVVGILLSFKTALFSAFPAPDVGFVAFTTSPIIPPHTPWYTPKWRKNVAKGSQVWVGSLRRRPLGDAWPCGAAYNQSRYLRRSPHDEGSGDAVFPGRCPDLGAEEYRMAMNCFRIAEPYQATNRRGIIARYNF
jgi:hypothetical protein